MAVRLGERNTRMEYLLCMLGAYVVIPVAAWLGLVPLFSLLAWGSLPLAIKSTRVVFRERGRPLNAALAATGQTALVFSLLFWLGLLLA